MNASYVSEENETTMAYKDRGLFVQGCETRSKAIGSQDGHVTVSRCLLNENGGYREVVEARWQAHNAPVAQICWAPSTCGHMLATRAAAVAGGSGGAEATVINVWQQKCEKVFMDDNVAAAPIWSLLYQLIVPKSRDITDMTIDGQSSTLAIYACSSNGIVAIFNRSGELAHQLIFNAPLSSITPDTSTVSSLSATGDFRSTKILAVGSGSLRREEQANVHVLRHTESKGGRWTTFAQVNHLDEPVRYLCFSTFVPSGGYLFLAVATDNYIWIFPISVQIIESGDRDGRPIDIADRYQLEECARLDEHKCQIDHLRWDPIGTLHATSRVDSREYKYQKCGEKQWKLA